MQQHHTARIAPRAPIVTIQAICPDMVYILANLDFWQRYENGRYARRITVSARIANYVRHKLSNYDQAITQAQTDWQALEVRRQVYQQIAKHYPTTHRHCAARMRRYYRIYNRRQYAHRSD